MPSRLERPLPCLHSLAQVLKYDPHSLADVVLFLKEQREPFRCHGLVLEARSALFRQTLFDARSQHLHSAECFLSRCKYIIELDHPFDVSCVSVVLGGWVIKLA